MIFISFLVVLVLLVVIFKTGILNTVFGEAFRKIYARDTARLQKNNAHLSIIVDAKSKLFGSMLDVIERVGGPILELGAGSGSNLEFYPEGTKLHTVDLNEHFREYLEKNIKTYSHVELEKYLLCNASNMGNVPDETYSCVVSTLLLCCTDQPKALDEIYRVLKPGGRFYFMEHIREEPGTIMYFVQYLIMFIRFLISYKKVRSKCDVTSTCDKVIETRSDFVNLSAYIFYRPIAFRFSFCKKTYIGYMDKPCQ